MNRWLEAPPGLLNNPSVSYLAYSYRESIGHQVKVLETTHATACCYSNVDDQITSDSVTWLPVDGLFDLTHRDEPKPLLKCFQATLAPGTHVLQGCYTRTGVFLHRPHDTMGGSCGDSSMCPAGAVGCRRDPGGGVLCYGCSFDSSATYTCLDQRVDVMVESGPPSYAHPNVTKIDFVSSDIKCTNFSITLDGVIVKEGRDDIQTASSVTLRSTSRGRLRVERSINRFEVLNMYIYNLR